MTTSKPNIQSKGLNKGLIEAAHRFDIKKIKDFLDKGADVNAKDDKGNTALHYCMLENYYLTTPFKQRAIAVLLKEAGSNLEKVNGQYENALQVAVKQGPAFMVDLCLQWGVSADAQDLRGNLPLDCSIQPFINGRFEDHNRSIFIRLLEVSKEALKKENDRWSALNWALHYSHQSDDKITPTKRKRAIEAFDLLLEAGANPNVSSTLGGGVVSLTPVHFLIEKIQSNTGEMACQQLQQILDAGVEMEPSHDKGGGYLHALVRASSGRDFRKMFKLFLERGVDVKRTNLLGLDVLAFAKTTVTPGKAEEVQSLITEHALSQTLDVQGHDAIKQRHRI